MTFALFVIVRFFLDDANQPVYVKKTCLHTPQLAPGKLHRSGKHTYSMSKLN